MWTLFLGLFFVLETTFGIPSLQINLAGGAEEQSSGSSETSGSSINYNLDWYNTKPSNTINPLFTKSIARFAVDLYEAISSTKKGNVIMSPFSAQTALSLLYCGAGGDTATTMADSLDFQNQTSTAITTQYQKILAPLQKNPSLSIANAIYVMNGLKIQPTFLTKATNDFYSKIENIDFAQNVAAVNTINKWVSDETCDKIQNLLGPGDVDASTRSVLLNAIYFKGTWVHHFPLKRTHPATFNYSCSASTEVSMMHVNANFNYKFDSDLNAQVIELPYAKSEVTMVLILPKDIDGLQDLQETLRSYDLTQLQRQFVNQEVFLSMPKFTIETTLDLNGPLTDLGMGILFSGAADLSKMLTDSNGLPTSIAVAKVIQKAFIEVDETGATAAAATAIVAPGAAAPPSTPPPRFIANHPFALILKTPVSVLFMGTYTGPK